MKKLLFVSLFLFCLAVILPSCVKTEFDEPPTTGTEINISDADVVNINDLIDIYSSSSNIIALDDIETLTGKYIKGVVVADDATGNFYKNFVLQDATAGIAVKVGRTDFYPFYSEGRTVYVKLAGLFMGDFRGVVQLGGFINGDFELDNIVNTDVSIFPGERGEPVEPALRTIGSLTNADISTVIRLTDVEFENAAINLTYADAPNQSTENRIIKDCDGNEITVRTSGYADFAETEIPNGNGTVVGIYSIYEAGTNTTRQLLLRRAEEVVMEGERCDGSSGGGGGGEPGTPVDELFEDFNSFNDGDLFNKDGWYNYAIQGSRQWEVGEFQGTIAAEFSGYNASSSTLEGWLITPPINLTSPKYLSFKSAFAFYDHDGLEVFISTDFDGDNPNDATWTNLNPTLADGATNDWNEYVASGDIDISGFGNIGYIGFKYTGNNTDMDSNWLVDDISVSSTPSGGGGGGGGGGGDDEPLDELVLNLESLSYSDGDVFAENGWINIATVGTRQWLFDEFDGDATLRNSAYNDTNPEMESWLITPLINFSNPKQMNFMNGHAFYTHNGLTVWYSGDYEIGDPNSATWEELDFDLAPSNSENYTLSPSGEIDLSEYTGNGRIAFKYEGNSTDETTTWIIDELSITDL